MIWIALGAAATLFAIIVGARLLMARTGCEIRTTRLHVTVADLPRDVGRLRVVLLSDLHVGALHVPFDDIVQAVNACDPDILLLGGDYAVGSAAHQEALELVRLLTEGPPTFGVLGNTDHYQHLDTGVLREMLQASGGDLLVNEAARIRVGSLTVEVLGVDDPLHGTADVPTTLGGASGGADLRIGICHSPALWDEAPRLGAAITLFGHTHGGQVRFPGMEAPVTHLTYPAELAAGLFRYEQSGRHPRRLADHWEIVRRREPLRVSTAEGPLMYVSRGVGMGIVPVRILCPPELLCMDFESEQEDGADADG